MSGEETDESSFRSMVGLFVLSAVAQYGGAALAVSLFSRVPAPSVAWARVAVAAAVVGVGARVWTRPLSRRDAGVAAMFGVFLATMNVSFYVAIDRLPLGNAVAIEFLGPVGVAAVTGRGWRDRAGIALAAVGVVLLAGVTLRGGAEAAVGLAAILVAAGSWAAYILLGRRVARAGDGLGSLAVGLAAGALAWAPFLAWPALRAATDPVVAAQLTGIALLSSVIPYAIEQWILRRVSAARFSILLALLPATAAVVGAAALGQWPGLAEGLGIVLVCAAILLSRG